MKSTKYLLIGVVVILLVIIGIVMLSLNENDSNNYNLDDTFVQAPSVDIEATIILLNLDYLRGECEEPEVCPRDRATIRIDKIDKRNDPNNNINLNVGEVKEFYLKYSARPAILRADITPSCQEDWVLKSGSCVREGCEGSDCLVSSPTYEEIPSEMENGFIVYHLPMRREQITETVLPGLEDGLRIRIRDFVEINLITNEIYEYELI